ncbi:uncharacterized protein EV422DRAFT_490651 [Fimicolochytrium jonesii]|uniref:uncharacterized protein n=1 Tax=Fimicolochytrium jonesii TaxID=1396493 RepID=UPI0022FE1C86|nr:uncharacterized protein EV422DRAFT_490651 [Fimicolochytrium jonesii]KAI8826943.1 hypothetical protein EV422DRAFT_490651 [Fimicolochytrium jonesii]
MDCDDCYKCARKTGGDDVDKKCSPACFKCTCGKLFKKLYNLKNHYQSHFNPTPEKPFVCEVCQRGFMRKHDLKRHATTHMETFTPFACDVCHTTFTRLDALHRHVNGNRCKGSP